MRRRRADLPCGADFTKRGRLSHVVLLDVWTVLAIALLVSSLRATANAGMSGWRVQLKEATSGPTMAQTDTTHAIEVQRDVVWYTGCKCQGLKRSLQTRVGVERNASATRPVT
jgi:hypothetical protein